LSSPIVVSVKGSRHSGDDGTIVPLVGMDGLKTHGAKICVPERYFECIGRGYSAAARAI
jgi:hypothetical protein